MFVFITRGGTYSRPKCNDFKLKSRGVFRSAPKNLLPPKPTMLGRLGCQVHPLWVPFGEPPRGANIISAAKGKPKGGEKNLSAR